MCRVRACNYCLNFRWYGTTPGRWDVPLYSDKIFKNGLLSCAAITTQEETTLGGSQRMFFLPRNENLL